MTSGRPAIMRAGAMSAIAMVAIIPIQLVVFVVDPPPVDAPGWLSLFAESPLRGIFAMDGLYIVNNLLLMVVLLALYEALAHRDQSLARAGLAVGLVSVAIYFTTNKAFEMLELAGGYRESDEATRVGLEAAARGLLVEYAGTAFGVYYVLGGVAILLFAAILAATNAWGRWSTWAALASGVLMLVPSTFGLLGLAMSVLSLIPWTAFCILAARRLLGASRFDARFDPSVAVP